NMIVLAPADFEEAKAATIFAAEYDGPVYIRLGRSPVASIFTKELPFALGKAELLAEMTERGRTASGIVSTGACAYQARLAAKGLDQKGGGVAVLHGPSIKPGDEEARLELAEKHDGSVAVEEHQIAGGLGGAGGEFLSGGRPT